MDERQQLEKAITRAEILNEEYCSDDVIDASVVTLREKLVALQVPEQQRKWNHHPLCRYCRLDEDRQTP